MYPWPVYPVNPAVHQSTLNFLQMLITFFHLKPYRDLNVLILGLKMSRIYKFLGEKITI